jgi:histidinol-phosphatase (PHP family)
MMLTNYHAHTIFCDGNDTPEELAHAAFTKGFTAFGFSAHAPAPKQKSWTLSSDKVHEYLQRIEGLKEEYNGKMEIYSGMEVDYLPGKLGPSSPHIRELNLDYTIGSLHIIRVPGKDLYPTIDGPIEEFRLIIDNIFNKSWKDLITHYFSLIRRMVEEHSFDIVGHFDQIKARHTLGIDFSENEAWYRNAVLETLEAISRKEIILEINTGGKSRGKSDSFYPSTWILREAYGLGIPVTISSDAHCVAQIDAMFPEAVETVKEAGYTTKKVLLRGIWQEVPL